MRSIGQSTISQLGMINLHNVFYGNKMKIQFSTMCEISMPRTPECNVVKWVAGGSLRYSLKENTFLIAQQVRKWAALVAADGRRGKFYAKNNQVKQKVLPLIYRTFYLKECPLNTHKNVVKRKLKEKCFENLVE